MRILLDTHVYLWSRSDPSRLSARERSAVRDPSNELFLSVASAWEIEITRAIGKLDVPDDWMDRTAAFGVRWLPVRTEHVRELRRLPQHHRNPFDRMIVAQSRVEGLSLLTHDPLVLRYLQP